MVRLDLPFYSTIALCVGPALFLAGFRDLKLRRLIENTPTARIRSMAMGLVEIQGNVLERSSVCAPFSGRDCAYWEVDIAVRSNRQSWVVVHRKNSGQPFYVSDGTGVALVYPEGSQCRVPSGTTDECQGFGMPDCYEQYMAEQNLWQRHLWRLSGMRFRERTLDEGQHVFVVGSAEPRAPSLDVAPDLEWVDDGAVPWVEPDLGATGTDGVKLVPAVPAPGAPVAIVARTSPALGLVQGIAWTRSGAVAPAHDLAAGPRIPPRGPGRVQALHGHVSAVIRRGSNDPTFLISAESMISVETSLALSTLAKLAGGPVLTVFGLGFWLLWMSAHHLLR
jgi:E3 ubiquitin ligase